MNFRIKKEIYIASFVDNKLITICFEFCDSYDSNNNIITI